jgi:regulator of cell morphogenesis and NO signaling
MLTIDVTVIEPRLKHPTIFQRFDELSAGESMIIHNDHDPKPLYYQMIAERGQVFEWEYLLSGPEIWEVKITRLATGEKPTTIGELVASDYRKAEVFRKFGLDFCCGGKKSVRDACAEKGIDTDAVEKELNAIGAVTATPGQDFKNWDLDFLADYIVATHHKYVKGSAAMLEEYCTKVARVHGDRHPEMHQVLHHLMAVLQELSQHMMKEEHVLFPYIKELAQAAAAGTKITPPPFGSVKNPIAMMEAEHETAGNDLRAVNELTSNYTPPADACNTYRVLFGKLAEFEKDLHQHIHLENNILFPKAIELEQKLMQ